MNSAYSQVKKAMLPTVLVLAASLMQISSVNADSIEEGRRVAEDRQRGNCYSCHQAQGAELAGNIGPPFVAMKARFPQRSSLYEQISDPRLRNPDTVMPPYGAHGILTERELNLVVDYLLSL